MKTRGRALLLGTLGLAPLGLALPRPAVGQQPRPAEAAVPVFRAGTDVVTLDVVVRDKKGKTVRDLRPDEVQIFEDGVPQQIVSFRLEAAGTEEDLPSSTAAQVDRALGSLGAATVPRHYNLVTLVFDQLGVDGRLIARRAAQDLLGLADRPDLVISIFQVKESLRLVQQFTGDREVLRAAVLEVTGQAATQYTRATEQLEEASRQAAESRARFESTAGGGAAAAGILAQLGQAADVDRMAVDALRLTESLQREQQGHSSLFSILALAKQQQRLAGRKTILFFAEGLQVPPSLEHVLQATVSEANRANVAVYAVDVRGLVADRRMEATRETLERARAASERAMTSRGVGAVPKEEVLAPETALTALRMDVQGALQDLAEGTGGLLIADSNDVRKGIARAVGDLRGYYELVYEPTRKEYDGRFRRIEVRVRRPNVVVQARSGYFAIPPEEGTATFAYEVDLLRALRVAPAPAEFPLRAAAFRFGPEEGGVRYTAVLEVPLADLAFEADGKGDTDRAHFSMMALVRDPTGAVVEKFSEDSPLFLPRARREALRQGNAVFTRSFRIAPGRYSLEAVVVDQVSRRRSVSKSALQVSRPLTRLSLSDITLVKRLEPVPKGALPSQDPFRLGDNRIVPFLTEPHFDGPGTLSLYLVAQTRGEGPSPDLLVELVQGKVLVGQTLLELPAPDSLGRIPYVAHLPLKDLAPGRYEVRVLLKQGGAFANGSTFFTVDGPAGVPPPAATSNRGARHQPGRS